MCHDTTIKQHQVNQLILLQFYRSTFTLSVIGVESVMQGFQVF